MRLFSDFKVFRGIEYRTMMLFAVTGLSMSSVAQERPLHDTSYYINYPEDVIGRIYMSEKYTRLDIKDLNTKDKIHYQANTNKTLGVGFTYKPLTINIGLGFGFLNKDDAKGKTKSLDIKRHVYSNKWVADLYAQFYKSFYAYSADI